jgi:arylsulfatase A-like enzyme
MNPGKKSWGNWPVGSVCSVLAAAIILVGCGDPDNAGNQVEPESVPPHIIVLVADDLGVGYAPCLSAPAYTSHLSRLCEQSLVFQNAYTHPVCTPSRAAMMTGRHTFRTGSGSIKQNAHKLSLDEITFPELIREHSQTPYQFAAFGKWHLASDQTGGDHNPNLQGFDYFEGNPRQHRTYRYYDYPWFVNGKLISEHETTYKTTHIVDRAIAHFTDKTGSNPWLYWIGFVNPHLPFHLPPIQLHKFKNLGPQTLRSVWGKPKSENQIQINQPAPQVVPYYVAMVQALDTEIERLVNTITSLSDRPILFFFLGDNGDAGEVASPARTGLRGAKAMLYEAGVRVPLMVWSTDPTWAEKFSGKTDRLTHLADLFPTLSEIAGVPPEIIDELGFSVDGASFAGAIAAEKSIKGGERLYIQRGDGDALSLPTGFGAIADNGDKLTLRMLDSEVPEGVSLIEFFNLRQDPGERDNLFPAICHDNPEAFWNLFDYIADLHASEEVPYGGFDVTGYRHYVRDMFATHGCSIKTKSQAEK